MSVGREAVRHAGGRYRRLLAPLRHPIESVEAEAHHLHELEEAGEAAGAPFIAIAGLFLFLLPIFLVIVGLAFAAYYIAR
jgi:hypothetical protein